MKWRTFRPNPQSTRNITSSRRSSPWMCTRGILRTMKRIAATLQKTLRINKELTLEEPLDTYIRVGLMLPYLYDAVSVQLCFYSFSWASLWKRRTAVALHSAALWIFCCVNRATYKDLIICMCGLVTFRFGHKSLATLHFRPTCATVWTS